MDNEREPEKKMEDRSTRYLRKFCVHACSVAQSCVTLWTVSCQVPLSMGFSRQEYCSGLPFSLPADLPTQGPNLPLLSLIHCRRILYCLATAFLHQGTWGEGKWGCIWDHYRYGTWHGSKIKLQEAEFRRAILFPLLSHTQATGKEGEEEQKK